MICNYGQKPTPPPFLTTAAGMIKMTQKYREKSIAVDFFRAAAVRHTTFSILWCHFECDYRHVWRAHTTMQYVFPQRETVQKNASRAANNSSLQRSIHIHIVLKLLPSLYTIVYYMRACAFKAKMCDECPQVPLIHPFFIRFNCNNSPTG